MCIALVDRCRQSSPNDEKENDTKDDKKKRMDQIVWNKTEDLLRPAEADILEIFDWQVSSCCSVALR